jgi:hypothetical protein
MDEWIGGCALFREGIMIFLCGLHSFPADSVAVDQ